MDWGTILTSGIVAGIASAAMTTIFKVLGDRHVAAYQAQLKANHDQQLEQIKSEYQSQLEQTKADLKFSGTVDEKRLALCERLSSLVESAALHVDTTVGWGSLYGWARVPDHPFGSNKLLSLELSEWLSTSRFYVNESLRSSVKELASRVQHVESVIKDAKRQLVTGEPSYVDPAFTLQELMRVQTEAQELATVINEELQALIQRGLASK